MPDADEHCDAHLGPIKYGEYLDYLDNCFHLKDTI